MLDQDKVRTACIASAEASWIPSRCPPRTGCSQRSQYLPTEDVTSAGSRQELGALARTARKWLRRVPAPTAQPLRLENPCSKVVGGSAGGVVSLPDESGWHPSALYSTKFGWQADLVVGQVFGH